MVVVVSGRGDVDPGALAVAGQKYGAPAVDLAGEPTRSGDRSAGGPPSPGWDRRVRLAGHLAAVPAVGEGGGAYALGTPLFLFGFFENFARLLPANA